MPAKKTSTPASSSSKNPNTGLAIVAYILFFVPLLTEFRDDPFVKFHVKQGLVLFLAAVGVGIFSMVPIIGWLLALPLNLALLVLWIIGIINAVNGEKKPLPLIGQYADNFNL